MKLGILFIVIGAVLLLGNLVDMQVYPVWAFGVRILFSVSVLAAGVFRIVYRIRGGRVNARR